MIWDERLVYGALLCMLMIGLFLGLAIDASESFSNIVFRWQTMIAGILAIVAAFITVLQMSATDRRQQARHEHADQRQQDRHIELVRLSLRSDRLRALRAADRAEWLEDMNDTLGNAKAVDGEELSAVRVHIRALELEISNWLKVIEKELNHRSIKGAEDLFDPQMAFDLDRTSMFLDEMRAAQMELHNSLYVGSLEQALGVISSCDYAAKELYDAVHDFSEDLRKLGATYA